MRPTRRGLLRGAGLLGSLGLLGGPALLRAEDDQRHVLLFFCRGGWDTTTFFYPAFDTDADMPEGSQQAWTGDIPWVDGEDRPAVRSFMDAHGSELCLVNGIEVRSVTHDRCQRLVMTGSSSLDADDWGALLAAHSGASLRLPHVVVQGPAFSSLHGSHVVRVGRGGQLPGLLDGSALDDLDQQVAAPGTSQAVEDLLAARSRALSEREPSAVGRLAAEALERGRGLDELGMELSVGQDFRDQLVLALDCFEQKLSRSALVTFDGLWDQTFDSHADNAMQVRHFDLLFEELAWLREELELRGLLERTTVLVFSEMGRHPQLNSLQGKHHWTHTSAMLFGAGVRGGQVVGGFGEDHTSLPVDLASGQTHDSGTPLLGGHLGATLLKIAGVDPEGLLSEAPIEAILLD